MFSIVFSLTLARALPPIHGERLFKVETRAGEVSFVLAAPHDAVAPSQQSLAPVTRAARDACEVWLQGDLFREPFLSTRAPFHAPGLAATYLSAAQRPTFHELTKVLDTAPDLRPSIAATVIRGSYGDALGRVADAFEDELALMSTDEQHERLNQVALNPHLDEAVRLLFGHPVPPAELVLWAAARADDPRHGKRLEELVAAEASSLGRPVTTLTIPEDQGVMAAQLRLHGDETVRLMVDQLAPRLADPAGAYVDQLTGALIEWELADRYFTMSAADYGRVQEGLAKSLVGRSPFFAGDDALAEVRANVHARWFDELAEAVDYGGALIVLDAERVIPGVNPRVKRTLLEELEARGAEITPLAAERTTVRVVK